MPKKESIVFGKTMDAYYVFLSQTFGTKPQAEEKLNLRIFSDRASFNAYQCQRRNVTSIPEWVAGTYFFANPNELVVHWDGRYMGIFYHEGFHQFAHMCWPEIGHWPTWFNEGCAAFLETCQYKGGKIGHKGKLRQDYNPQFQEFIKKHPDFSLEQWMQKRTGWNDNGYDYAIAANLISTMLGGRNVHLKAHSQKFFRTLRETQDYEKSLAVFTEKLTFEQLKEMVIKNRPR